MWSYVTDFLNITSRFTYAVARISTSLYFIAE